jgi:hypothetical protein
LKAAILVLVAAFTLAAALEIVITEEQLQSSFDGLTALPNITSVEVDVRIGEIVVEITRKRPLAEIEDELYMEVELGVDDGLLEVTVEEAAVNGFGMNRARIDLWNERVADAIENSYKETDGLLESVSVGNNEIVLEWE